ncbi:MAG: hypothetical protein ACTSUC_17820 [Promethearchaeota archaeon]
MGYKWKFVVVGLVIAIALLSRRRNSMGIIGRRRLDLTIRSLFSVWYWLIVLIPLVYMISLSIYNNQLYRDSLPEFLATVLGFILAVGVNEMINNMARSISDYEREINIFRGLYAEIFRCYQLIVQLPPLGNVFDLPKFPTSSYDAVKINGLLDLTKDEHIRIEYVYFGLSHYQQGVSQANQFNALGHLNIAVQILNVVRANEARLLELCRDSLNYLAETYEINESEVENAWKEYGI